MSKSRKLFIILVGFVVLGMTNVFAAENTIEGRKIELSELDSVVTVSYVYKVTNKSDKDVSILMLKYTNDKSEGYTDGYEYVIPAKSTVTFVFTNEQKNGKEFWGFGWISKSGEVANGGAEWWSKQKNIVIDKDGYLTYTENNMTKKLCVIKKL